jgi:mRNA deadenylase 3'-5' endonuclease subunit Ccr4
MWIKTPEERSCHVSRKWWTIGPEVPYLNSIKDANIFYCSYTCRGILFLSIQPTQILGQSQAYYLYLKETTMSSNRVKILALRQASWECIFVEACNSTHTKKFVVFITKWWFLQQFNMKIISHTLLIWRRV